MSEDGETATDGMVIFPPRIGSLATRIGPITVQQGCYLLGSASLGALLGYSINGLAPHTVWATATGILAFVGAVVVGLILGFVRRADLPLLKYLALRQRFRARPARLEGEAAQAYVQLTGLTHDTLLLPNDVYVRVVEVKGVNFAILSSEEREEHIQGFLGFLNALDFDIQIITRPDRFDNRRFVLALCDRLLAEPPGLLHHVGASYLNFFDDATRETLDRKFYVATAVRLAQAAPHLFAGGTAPAPEERRQAAGKLLDSRVQSLIENLVTLGLDAEPLEGTALVDMLRSYYRFGSGREGGLGGGARSIVGALSPSQVQFFPDHTVVGSEYVRVLQVQDYPARLAVEFLTPLLTMPARVDVTLHVSPIPQDLALVMLQREIVRVDAERLVKVDRGSVDTAAHEHQVDVFRALHTSLTRQEERLYRTGLYISIRANSLEELDTLTGQVQGTLRGRMVKARAPVFQQQSAIKCTLPFGRDYLESGYPLQGSAIATMYPFVSGTTAQEGGVLYGFSELNETPVIFDRFREGNYNTCIFGASGSGKSYALKSEILRQMVLRPTLRVYVVDPLGEFGELTRSLDGAVLRVGPKEETFLNPMWMARTSEERSERAKAFFEVILDLSQEERALLDGVLTRMHRELHEEFVIADVARELSKVHTEQGDRLVLLLEPYLTGSYAFLNHRTTVDLSARMVTFDLNALMLQSRAMLVPVMFVVLDFIRARCDEDMEPKIFAVDEAWYLMGREGSAQALSDLSRHSRHTKTGLTLISQTAEDFIGDKRGEVILQNSAITALFRHKSVGPAMRERFGLTPDEVHRVKFARTGKEVGYSTALFLTQNTRTPIRVEAADFEHLLITSDPDEVKARLTSSEGGGSSGAPLVGAGARPSAPHALARLPVPLPPAVAPVAATTRRPADDYPSYFASPPHGESGHAQTGTRVLAFLAPPSSSVLGTEEKT
ncbi:MAG: ATP-binding protein [Euryarchaeota archaeon]|nr:ATP-binding protein [Euryarchaeota archaeon]